MLELLKFILDSPTNFFGFIFLVSFMYIITNGASSHLIAAWFEKRIELEKLKNSK